jgi:hypothetical protein
MEMVVGFVVLCWAFGYLSAYLVKLFVSVCGYLGFTAPRPTYFTFPPVSGGLGCCPRTPFHCSPFLNYGFEVGFGL